MLASRWMRRRESGNCGIAGRVCSTDPACSNISQQFVKKTREIAVRHAKTCCIFDSGAAVGKVLQFRPRRTVRRMPISMPVRATPPPVTARQRAAARAAERRKRRTVLRRLIFNRECCRHSALSLVVRFLARTSSSVVLKRRLAGN
jgi:hypothetical protein